MNHLLATCDVATHVQPRQDNFLIGIDNTKLIHVIDFGLSKRYWNPKTKQHIPACEGKSLTGTPRYASINNHRGLEQSRRDDMESLGYMLIYFARGSLPWQGIKANNKNEKYRKIMEKKMSTPLSSLCKGLPQELHRYLDYCRSLRFEDEPNYPHLRSLFRDAIKSNKYGDPKHGLDWMRTSESSRHTTHGRSRR